MGTASYVLAGTEGAVGLSFGPPCHGAGRRMSRKQARSSVGGRSVVREMEKRGVLVASASPKTLAEEIPEAYKDVSEVVDVVHDAGIARKVARLRPLAVVRGGKEVDARGLVRDDLRRAVPRAVRASGGGRRAGGRGDPSHALPAPRVVGRGAGRREGGRAKPRHLVPRRDGIRISSPFDVRVYSTEELSGMLHRAGMKTVAFFGSFSGAPLGEDSPRMVARARM